MKSSMGTIHQGLRGVGWRSVVVTGIRVGGRVSPDSCLGKCTPSAELPPRQWRRAKVRTDQDFPSRASKSKGHSLPHVLGLAMLGHPCLLHLWVLDHSVPSPGISPAQLPTPPSKAPSFVKVLIKCTLFSFLKSVTPFVFYSVTIIICITTYMHLKV